MTTPARKAALQWFHDRGETVLRGEAGEPSSRMVNMLVDDRCLNRFNRLYGRGPSVYSLTDKGRRMLHGDDK